jgi:predicted nucleic acid-binding protein
LDASIVGAWHFEDEKSAIADRLLDSLAADFVLVPVLWWFEVRNLLLQGERRNRSTAEKTSLFLQMLAAIEFEYAPLPDDALVMPLARRHQLSFYDAVYLDLARHHRIGLATFDHKLAAAARAEGVALIG